MRTCYTGVDIDRVFLNGLNTLSNLYFGMCLWALALFFFWYSGDTVLLGIVSGTRTQATGLLSCVLRNTPSVVVAQLQGFPGPTGHEY